MISKVASLRSQTKLWSRIITSYRKNCFSTVSTEEQLKQLEELVNLDRQLKDEHYEDLAYKFERDWAKVRSEKKLNQVGPVDKTLTPNERSRIEMLANALLELNIFEQRYFNGAIRTRVETGSGTSAIKLNLNMTVVNGQNIGSWPPNNPNWVLQQEAIARLWPAGQEGITQLFGTAAVAADAGASAQAAAAQEEVKPAEEKVVEKDKFDIELNAIDASKKIAIIKEVRELLKLGLKEAKEMVEKAPVVLKRDVKKEEAGQLKDKLAALGCTINLL